MKIEPASILARPGAVAFPFDEWFSIINDGKAVVLEPIDYEPYSMAGIRATMQAHARGRGVRIRSRKIDLRPKASTYEERIARTNENVSIAFGLALDEVPDE